MAKAAAVKFKEDIVFPARLAGRNFIFHSTWGLFSPAAIDAGTELLASAIKINPEDNVLDLGCGYGALGVAAAALAPKGEVDMVDKDFTAVEYAAKNALANGLKNCRAYLSNAFSKIPPNKKFDAIISNLPAKVGNEMLAIIIDDAFEYLKPGGRFYVVAVAGLREFLKRKFSETFGNYEKLKQSKTYAVVLAVKK